MKRWEPHLEYLPARPDLGIDTEHPVALMTERADGQFYLVADVEAANAWRYDEPEEVGEYLVSWRRPDGKAVVSKASWRNSYFGDQRRRWDIEGVYAYLPLPEPAKEKP